MTEKVSGKQRKKAAVINVQEMAVIAVISALLCILAPLSIPIGPVPISLTSLVLYVSLYVLGCKKGMISYLIYLLIGLVGVPVFSGFSGGPAKLFGPTGGYLIGFIPMIWIAGMVIDRYLEKWYICLPALLLGTMVCYALGTAWLSYQAHMEMPKALAAGVLPFIPGDLIKIAVAMLLGPQIHKQLKRAHLLEQ